MPEPLGRITTYSNVIAARYNPNEFVGRKWLIEEITRFRDDEERRYLVIVGEPGSGKSTLLAYLAESWNCPRHFIRVGSIDGVIGVDPRHFLLSLGTQLRQKYGPQIFEQAQEGSTSVLVGLASNKADIVGRLIHRLYTLPFLDEPHRDVRVSATVVTGQSQVVGEEIKELINSAELLDETTLLHVALINPLRKIEQFFPTEKVVILIDALDEAFHHTGVRIPDILPRATDTEFPANLRLIMTSRPGEITNIFRSDDLLYLDDKKRGYWQANQQDIQSYIEKRLAEAPFAGLIAAWKREEVDDYVVQVLEHSQNNFLYLYYFFNELAASIQINRVDLRNFGIPKGLSEIYRSFAVEKIRRNADSTIRINAAGEIPISLLAQLKTIPNVSAVEIVECDILLTTNDSDQVTPVLFSLLQSVGLQNIKFQTQKAEQLGVWEEKYLPILGVMAVAYEPLYREQIAGFARVEVVYVDSVLARLKQFLEEVVDERATAYQFYHTSFSEYLLDSQQNRDYPLDGAKYHAQIAFYYRMGKATWKEVDWETLTDRYLFSYLPVHLSELEGPSDLDGLITLGLSGFVQQKIRYTRDVTGADRDFFYFFQACLRLGDLPNALKLARQRVGIASLNDWLTSDALAPVLRHLAPNSAFATKMIGALEGIEPVPKRAAQLIAFMRPGLPEVFYSRIRAEFERNWGLINDRMHHDFLIAVAQSENGAIDYVLGKAQRSSISKDLTQAIIRRLGPLCHEDRLHEDQALAELGWLVSGNVKAFVAAADAVADEQDTERALRILEALRLVLPKLESEELGIMGIIALAQAFTQHGKTEQAKTLVQYCLDHIPPPIENYVLHLIHEEQIAKAGARLIQAAAPFPELWERAVAEGRMLAARARGLVFAASTLAQLLHVTPAIPDPKQRIAWLSTILSEIRDLAAQDMSETVMRRSENDYILYLSQEWDDKPIAIALLEPLVESIRDLYHDIDRVLVDADHLAPLVDLTYTLGALWSKSDEPDALVLESFHDVVPATACSTNMSVSIVTFSAFTKLVAKYGLNINEAIAILRRAFITVATTQSTSRAILLLNDWCEQVEEKWSYAQPELSTELTFVLLNAVEESRKPELLHALDACLRRCYNTASPTDRDLIWSKWATTHILVGEGATGLAMINKLLHDREPEEESLADAPPWLRILVAEALVKTGEKAQACQLLRDAVVEPDLTNKDSLEVDLELARILLRAGEQVRARKFIVTAAHRYRQAAGSLSWDIEEVLLSGVAELNDHVLVEELLALAEAELLEDTQLDSAYAVRWYALLSLAVSDEQLAAERLWRELSGWKIDYRRSEVFGTIVAITHAGLYSKPWNDLLAQLRTELDAIKSTDLYGEALTHVTRLLTFSMPDLRAALVKVLLEHAEFLITDDFFSKRKRFFWDILSILTQRLVTLGDVALLMQAIDQMERLLRRLETKNVDMSNYLPFVLQQLLMLSQCLPSSERLSVTLNSIIQQSSAVKDSYSASNLLVRVLRQIDQRMRTHARDLLLKHALSRIQNIVDDHDRTNAWVKLAEVLVQQPHTPEGMHLTIQMVEALATDPAPHDMRLVMQAKAYQSCVQGSLQGTATEELERRVRTEGQPERVSAQVARAAALLPTPLNMQARQVIDELYANLDRFTIHQSELGALKQLLELEVELRHPDASNRLLAVAKWAVTMPLVNNEDVRDVVFLDILSATTILAPSQRADVQYRVLHYVWHVWQEFSQGLFWRRFVHIPLETEVAEATLVRYLEATDIDGEQTPAEKLEELICTSWSSASKDFAHSTALVLCRLLDRYAPPIHIERREDLARIACECSHTDLKRQLDKALRRSYELQGVADLRDWGLLFLAHLPTEWWIEHFTRISLAQVQRDKLISWVEYCMAEVPATVSVAVMIATAWASRDIPGELNALWFELATSESPIPLTVRSALTDMLIAL